MRPLPKVGRVARRVRAAAAGEDAWLVVERGGGLKAGERFDLFGRKVISFTFSESMEKRAAMTHEFGSKLIGWGSRYVTDPEAAH